MNCACSSGAKPYWSCRKKASGPSLTASVAQLLSCRNQRQEGSHLLQLGLREQRGRSCPQLTLRSLPQDAQKTLRKNKQQAVRQVAMKHASSRSLVGPCINLTPRPVRFEELQTRQGEQQLSEVLRTETLRWGESDCTCTRDAAWLSKNCARRW